MHVIAEWQVKNVQICISRLNQNLKNEVQENICSSRLIIPCFFHLGEDKEYLSVTKAWDLCGLIGCRLLRDLKGDNLISSP